MLCDSCDFCTNALLFLSFVIGVLYLWLKHEYGYWERRGVYSPPAQFPVGHLGLSGIKESIGLRITGWYGKTKAHPFVGLVLGLKKTLLVNDLDLAKSVLLKDFAHFQSHGVKMDSKSDPLAGHLFNLDGEEWKKMRVKLTPTFTSSKMKYMFETMFGCSKVMVKYIEENVESGKLIDLKEVIAKFGTDVIGSCAFGIQTNSFKYPDAEFRKMGKKMFQSNSIRSILDLWTLLSPKTVPKVAIKWVNGEINEFFTKTITDTINQREGSQIERKDFLQLLINMKNSDVKSGNHMTMEEVLPQVFIFFVAGFETSSTVATYAFLELAKNPEVQKKAQQYIDAAMEECDGDVTYDTLNQMSYLTQIVEEAMRMYPPLPFLFRECSKEYKIPGTEVIIEKGTQVLVPALGIQRDPEIYPDPMSFDPDRFTPENLAKRHQFSRLPFGEGPRICIGSRFGIMQVKLGLFMILRHFNVELSEQSSKPLAYDPTSFLLHTKGDMLMKLTPRLLKK